MSVKEVGFVMLKILLYAFNFAKKIYLWLFNFMVGEATRKFDRFSAHLATIFLLFLCPPVYFNVLVQIFTAEISLVLNQLPAIVIFTAAPALLACMIKFMIRFF